MILAACLMACAVSAGEFRWTGPITLTNGTNTNTTVSVTNSVFGCSGDLAKIIIDETVAGADVDIDITAHSQGITTMDAFTLYSADDVTADTTLWPAFDRTGTDGVALTNDPPEPYTCIFEELRVVISDWNATGKTFTVQFGFRDAQ